MNKVFLSGRITQDIELKTTTNSGKSVISFSLAVRRSFKNANGEYDTDFINCVCWGAAAETIAKHFRKGDGITVDGEIRMRKYSDKDGNNRTAFEINVNGFEFPISRKGSQSSESSANINVTVQDNAAAVTDSDGFKYEEIADIANDDIPF